MITRGVTGNISGIAGMSSEALKQRTELRTAFHSRWEAVEIAKAQELAAMTEERAREIIQSRKEAEAWRADPAWSGLVEQQALFFARARGVIRLRGVLKAAEKVQAFCQERPHTKAA